MYGGRRLLAHVAEIDAQTQTMEWPGAREYTGGIPKRAGKSVPTPVEGEGDYVDMSGVHALRDVRREVWTEEPLGV